MYIYIYITDDYPIVHSSKKQKIAGSPGSRLRSTWPVAAMARGDLWGSPEFG